MATGKKRKEENDNGNFNSSSMTCASLHKNKNPSRVFFLICKKHIIVLKFKSRKLTRAASFKKQRQHQRGAAAVLQAKAIQIV